MKRKTVINPAAYEETIKTLLFQALDGNKEAKDLLRLNCQQMDYNHLIIFLKLFESHANLVQKNSNIFDDLAGEMLDDLLRIDDEKYPEIFKSLEQNFAGSAWAQLILGYFHEIGIDGSLPRDIKKAEQYYKSAMTNCPRAKAHLGNLYSSGKTFFDMKIAIQCWQEAAQKNDPLAQAQLASLYAIGYEEIIPKDDKLALEYFQSSLKQNHHTGHALYAHYLENKFANMLAITDNLKTIKQTAVQQLTEINNHYKIAADYYRSPIGCAYYAKFLVSHNLLNESSRAEDYYLFAIKHNEPKGYAFLARYVIEHKKSEEADLILKQVENLRDPEICGLLAAKLFAKLPRSEADKIKAEALAKIAARFENIEGLIILGAINYKTEEGRAYLAKAAAKNDPLAFLMLGKMHATIDENNRAALYYYQRTVRQGWKFVQMLILGISPGAWLYYSTSDLFKLFRDSTLTTNSSQEQSQSNKTEFEAKSILNILDYTITNFAYDLYTFKNELDEQKQANCNSTPEISDGQLDQEKSQDSDEETRAKNQPLPTFFLTGTEDEDVTPWYIEEERRQEEERRKQRSFFGKSCTIV